MEGAGRPRPFQTLQLKPDDRDSSVVPVELQQNLLAHNGRRSWLAIHEARIQFGPELDQATRPDRWHGSALFTRSQARYSVERALRYA